MGAGDWQRLSEDTGDTLVKDTSHRRARGAQPMGGVISGRVWAAKQQRAKRERRIKRVEGRREGK